MKNLFYRKYYLIIISLVFSSIHIQAQNGWTHKSYQPTPSAGASASVIDNKIYVMGGVTGAPSYTDLNVNEVYDPLTNTWDTTKAKMPTPRGFLLTCVVSDTIYAIGGGYHILTNKNEAYDPVTDTWTTKAPMIYPWVGVYGGVVNDSVYTMGGNYNSRLCFKYNMNSWQQMTSIPVGGCVGPLSATVYNGLIYTFGGATNYPNGPLSTVNAYNPQTDTWDTTLAHMPTPRYALRTFLVNEKIYAIGGSQSSGTSLAKVEVYDPINDSWDTLSNMPFSNSWFTGAVVNNKIYVIGGTTDWATGDSSVWEYDPEFPTNIVNEIKIPTEFLLSQNYPNPFNPSTKIKYSVPQSANVIIKVFDILGNEIETLVNEEKPAGTFEITWHSANLPSGVYFYQLKSGSFAETKKMILLK